MVKSDKPLQIRLTEPVLFLKGPSTGLDFRGRPQVISADAQPAQLRGLLTLRLHKPTRIRKIEIKLEGRTRTEWPEGIGPRHMETHEEKKILDEKTTYFTAVDGSESRSRSTRRPASVGPGGIDVSQYDVPPDAIDLDGAEDVEDDTEGDARPARPPRSASALPGTHDRHSWHRDGFSRRPSFDAEDEDTDVAQVTARLNRMDVGPNEPSPAYTPLPEAQLGSRRSSFGRSNRSPRNGNSPMPTSREPDLTPIMSATTSRAASNRDGSSSTERRENPAHHPHSALTTVANEEDEPSGDEDEDGGTEWATRPEPDSRPSGSILHRHHEHHDHQHTRGTVCFVDGLACTANQEFDEAPPATAVPPSTSGRTASVRTLNSEHTASTTSLLHDRPPSEHSHSAHHPVDPVRTISVVSTTHNTPAHSTSASIRTRTSTDTLARDGTPPSDSHLDRVASGNAPVVSSPLSERIIFGDVPAPNTASSVPSGGNTAVNPWESALQHQGVTGSILNQSHESQDGLPRRPSLGPAHRLASEQSNRSVSFSVERQGGSSPRRHSDAQAEPTPDDARGRRPSKFSLSAALGAVKDRVSSKSRSRTASRQASRAGSVASLHEDDNGPSPRGSSQNIHSQLPPDLAAAVHSRHGAGVSGSKERTDSPRRNHGDKHRGKSHDDRSPSRGRGRHKGMKVLTDALGLGEHPPEGEEEVHNWKEFRKGTYNYPISFGIPPEAPPTLHAEFGSVTYRLKATVVRVGALTPNLTEDLEVTMIASPQEDDMEETENIIVERQWEEQMRYQITLGGKAFPIGGIIPISIRLMPLMKCKIHRLSVILEEKIDYFAHGKRITRHETPKKFILMFIKQLDKYANLLPLLPILSEDPDAAKESPLAPLAAQAARSNPPIEQIEPENEDWQYAQMMDPMGPWHFEKNLQIPDCASMVKVTSKHDKTSVQISHFLKVTIRVERGDDVAVDAKGRRKQFDIIIDTPIKILDCRINPSYNSLPTYAANNPFAGPPPGFCSIHGQGKQHAAALASFRAPFSQSAGPDQMIATALSQPMSRSGSHDLDHHSQAHHPYGTHRSKGKHKDRSHDDTLLERNIVYDRLMSGQETETGEVPPTYGEAVANAIRAASRSTSRHRLGGGSRGASRVVSAAQSAVPSGVASRRDSLDVGAGS